MKLAVVERKGRHLESQSANLQRNPTGPLKFLLIQVNMIGDGKKCMSKHATKCELSLWKKQSDYLKFELDVLKYPSLPSLRAYQNLSFINSYV